MLISLQISLHISLPCFNYSYDRRNPPQFFLILKLSIQHLTSEILSFENHFISNHDFLFSLKCKIMFTDVSPRPVPLSAHPVPRHAFLRPVFRFRFVSLWCLYFQRISHGHKVEFRPASRPFCFLSPRVGIHSSSFLPKPSYVGKSGFCKSSEASNT